ncbi:amino acid adenylation domain-containing protein [Marinomonas primoryensis]|uniref:amino acid adenylation domain-containing protein n=1 Tax=Marinomonas primoryensis TaxID=178399 RepID=UPI003703EADA
MAHQLIQMAKSQGVHLYTENGALKYRTEQGGLSSELSAALKQKKAEIILFLETHHHVRSAAGPVASPATLAAPLTYAQQRVFYLEHLFGEQGLYNMATGFRIKGQAELSKIEHAVNRVIERHSILRTGFTIEADKPKQLISAIAPIKLSIQRYNSNNFDEKQWINQQASLPFDLTRAPLIRIAALEWEAKQETVLVFVFHHMIFDGWSYKCFFNELNACLGGACQNPPTVLPALDFQYADFARWQQEGDEDTSTATIRYWKDKMLGVNELNCLPTDFPRPQQPDFHGTLLRQTLDKTTTLGLKTFAQQQGTSLFTMLSSVYSLLISRWTECPDVVIGTPVAGRDRQGLDSLIGFFVNTLALRLDIQPDQSFLELLESAKKNVADAFRYQEMPFETIVENAVHARKSSYAPILQLLFVLNEDSTNHLVLDNAEVEPLLVDRNSINFELELHINDCGDTLEMYWVYATSLFNAKTIEALCDSFSTLLHEVLTQPDKDIASLPLVSAAGERQIQLWNQTDKVFPQEHSFTDLFEAQVEKQPHATACIWKGRSDLRYNLSYRQLNEKANQLAHKLVSIGVKPDDCVGLAHGWSVNAIIGILAVLKAGAAYLPLDPNQPSMRLNKILKRASVDVLLTSEHADSQLGSAIENVFCLDDPELWASLSRLPSDNIDSRSLGVTSDHLAYVIFTSGSTGEPKGVMVEHRNVCNLLYALQDKVQFKSSDTVACITPPSFDIHLAEIYLPLIQGSTIAIFDWHQTRSPELMIACQKEFSVTVMQATPATWQMLVDHGWRPYDGLKMITGGDHLSLKLREDLLSHSDSVSLFNLYAPSEATVYCSGGRTDLSSERVHIGEALANNRHYILDFHKNHVPVGMVGELYIAGANITRGYLNQPELTAEKYSIDPFYSKDCQRMYQTGDLARWLPDGSVELVGRKDFQVKINGFRIELGEIEACISQHQAVEQVIITTVPSAYSDKVLVAYVKSQLSEQQLVGALRALLSEALPYYMTPTFFVVMTEFPLTYNRKVDRSALPIPTSSHVSEEHCSATTATEKVIAATWSELLSIDDPDIDQNFFTLGGHSLLAIKMISRLGRALAITLTLKVLFEAPSIRRLARLCDGLSADKKVKETFSIRNVDATNGVALSYSQQRLWTLDNIETHGRYYGIPLMYHIDGQIEVSALSQSLDFIVNRHDVLRTVYKMTEQGPVQRVMPPVTGILQHLDAQPFSDPRSALADFEKILFDQPFDLANGPIFRAGLVMLSENQHVLLLTIHHIAIDGWSVDILLEELQSCYSAFVDHKVIEKAPLAFQYADYAVWQRGLFSKQSQTHLASLEYWRARLVNVPEAHSLPTDFSRPVKASYRGETHYSDLSPHLSNQVLAYAKTQGTTPFTVLYSAFTVLLTRYSGSKDIVIGTPVANRELPDLDGLIGFFVNNIALRTHLPNDIDFAQLVSQNHADLLNDFAHQSLPFEKVIQDNNVPRRFNYHPIFQIMMVLEQSSSCDSLHLVDARLTAQMPSSVEARFDLTLGVRVVNGQLRLGWNFALDLFMRETIEELACHFDYLLQQMLSQPTADVMALALIPEKEQSSVLFANRRDTLDVDQTLLVDLFDRQLKRQPNHVALEYEGERLTYAELDKKANQLSHHLVTLGVGANVPVAVFVERSPQMIIAMLAILKAGGAYLPIDTKAPLSRLTYILEDSKTPVLLAQLQLFSVEPPVFNNCLVLDVDACSLQAYSEEKPPLLSKSSVSDLAYIIYTSGSTGRPKGVLVEQVGVVNYIKCQYQYLDLSASDIYADAGFLYLTNFSFDSSVASIWGSFYSGRPLHIVSEEKRFQLETLQKYLAEPERFAVAYIPPVLLAELALPENTPLIPRIIVSGEAVSSEVIERFAPHTRLFNEYGPTENSVCSTVHQYRQGDDPRNIGQGIDKVKTYVLDDALNLVPFGVVGHLYLAGAGIARGYLNQPELTEQRFIPSPFTLGERLYHSGDLVRRQRDGDLVYIGRSDEQIKIRGFRVELGEIEQQLNVCKGVEGALVMVQGTASGKRQLVAYVIAKQDNPVLPDEELFQRLIGELSHQLPDYMTPVLWARLDAWPLTNNGKIDKKALPKPRAVTQITSHVAPSTSIEIEIAGIWSKLLKCGPVSVHDNFFALGGDSIMSMQAVSRAAKLGLHFTVKQLFDNPTIFSLTPRITMKKRVQSPQVSVIGKLPLLPIQHEFFHHSKGKNLHHFNQSILLNVPADFSLTLLEQTVAALYRRHDALRLQFAKDADSINWQASFEPISAENQLNSVMQTGYDSKDSADLEAQCQRAQLSLNIEQGSIFKAVLLTSEAGNKLFLVIHHLVVDGVSWRIILDDLQLIYRQFKQGLPLVLEEKTASYQQWGQWLTSDRVMSSVESERPYWQKSLSDLAAVPPIPKDGAAHNKGQRGEKLLTLTVEQTQALLKDTQQAYGTEVQELLLSALLLGLDEWRKTREQYSDDYAPLSLTLETHGRDGLDGHLEVSQTLGWFTSNYPLVLNAERGEIGDLICAVKEKIRAVPNKGMGYGLLKWFSPEQLDHREVSPEILFNYFGQLDQMMDADSAFSFSSQATGEDGSFDHMQSYAIALNGRVKNDQLSFDFNFDLTALSPAAVSDMIDAITRALQQIIEHCSARDAVRLTPADVPLANVKQQDLDNWSLSLSANNLRITDVYPATGMQQGLLYHSELAKDAYVTQLTVSLAQIDPSVLKQAWQRVIARYDILRTAFLLADDGVRRQVVTDTAEINWRDVNLKGQSESQQSANIEALQAQDKSRGFDATLPTLMRFTCLKMDAGQFKLIWSNHHALMDGWCLPVIWSDLSHFYQSLLTGKQSDLPPVIPYGQYIEWLACQNTEEAQLFWTESLANIASPTTLPSRFLPESECRDEHSIKTTLRFSSQETQALEALAKNSQCTLNVLVQAAWGLVLSHYSRDETVIFGVTVSGRPAELPGIETMVGLFINTLPVVMKVPKGVSVTNWLRSIHKRHIDLEEHGYLPLQDIQQLSKIKGRNIFDSIVVFENYPVDELQGTASNKNRLQMNELASSEQTNYALTVIAAKSDVLEIKLLSQPGLLADWQLSELQKHIKNILSGMVATPHSCVQEIPLLSNAELDYQINELNDTYDQVEELGIHQWFERYVKRAPDSVALVDEQVELTYGEVNIRANQLARYLALQGVKANQYVGIVSERSSSMIVSMLAILKLGATYVPMDSKSPLSLLSYMMETCQMTHLLSDDSDIGECYPVQLVDIKQVPCILSSENIADLSCEIKMQPACVMFTSDSIDQPKGVMVAHRAILGLVKNSHYIKLSKDQVIAQISDPSLDASTFEIWGALLNGAKLAILSDNVMKNSAALSHRIDQHSIDVMFMPTAQVNQLLALKPDVFAALDTLLFKGEEIDSTKLDSLLTQGKPNHLLHVYGPTENTAFSTSFEITELASHYPIGRPITNTSAYVLSPENKLVPFGQVGELYLGGDGLAMGYLNRPDLTAEAFIENPFNQNSDEKLYRTGDLVRYMKTGDLVLVGRIGDPVSVRGVSIDLSIIRKLVLSHPKVEQAAVEMIAREGEKQLVVFIVGKVPEQGGKLSRAEIDELRGSLKGMLSRDLSSVMAPDEYVMLEALPLTASGQLDHAALHGAVLKNQVPKQVNTASPRDNIEMLVYQIWHDILLKEKIGIRDNFFEIGGSSISAIKVVHEIEKQLSVQIPVSELLKNPSIEALAWLIRSDATAAKSTVNFDQDLIQFRQGDGVHNVICIHPGGGTAFAYLALAKELPSHFGVYGIQAKGVDSDQPFLEDVQAMANHYISLIEHLLTSSHTIVGCSYGGYVSYEMARILQARGIDSMALLLDTEGTDDQSIRDKIEPVSSDVFREKLVTYNGMYPGIDDQQIDRYFRIYNHHLNTMKTMTLANTNAKTALIIATQDKPADYLPVMKGYWENKACGEFLVEYVDADHSTMLEAPSILSVAQFIQRELCN